MLYPVEKQTYKLELPRICKIYDAFYVLLLEQDTIKKGQINEFVEVLEFDKGDNKEYEVEAIRDNIVYAKEIDGHLSKLYYLVVWKGYPEEENIWKPSLAIMQL